VGLFPGQCFQAGPGKDFHLTGFTRPAACGQQESPVRREYQGVDVGQAALGATRLRQFRPSKQPQAFLRSGNHLLASRAKGQRGDRRFGLAG